MVDDPFADPLDDTLDPFPVNVLRTDRPEPERRIVGHVLCAVQRASDPHVHRGVFEEQPFLGRSPQKRAVRVGSAEIRVPRIEVRIEVHQGDGAVLPERRPK
jgi:hypothetical protein